MGNVPLLSLIHISVEDTLGWADIYVTTTGNCGIIRIEHMEKMKDQALSLIHIWVSGE